MPREALSQFCQRNHIRWLALFGSILRDDFGTESDVDVLVEFEPGYTPGLFQIYDMEQELSAFFGGRKVDLRTPQDLSKYFRDDVLRQAQTQYAKE
ncbi:MAG: nucleotidyltransferase family protein [Chloroflexi bacterium]|nr:nucleotidyltransferase family protein [Chloroflexota bacterium]